VHQLETKVLKVGIFSNVLLKNEKRFLSSIHQSIITQWLVTLLWLH